MADVDVVTQEVIQARLNGIVREMQIAVFRTGFSTIIRETHDFSCGLTDREGNVVGAAMGVVTHNGAYPDCIQGLLQFYGYDEMREGDSFVANTVYFTGCPHPMDLVVMAPVFYEGDVVAFCISMGHKSDIGGLLPGSRTTGARDVYGEGLQIYPVRLHRNYRFWKETEHFLKANSRSSHLVLGDLNAQAGALWSVGVARLRDLMDTYGKEVVLSAFRLLGQRTETRLRRELAEWRDSVAEGETFVNDIVEDRRIRVHVAAIKAGDRLILDFTQSGDQSQGPINIRPPFIRGVACQTLASMVDTTLSYNHGMARAVETRFRLGSLLDPMFPAPTGFYSKNLRAVEGVIMQALAKVAGRPGVAFGGTQSSMIIGSQGERARPYVQYEIFNAGSGAFDGGDGFTGIGHGWSVGARFTSMEILESEFDVELLGFYVLPDTGGDGKFRGGPCYARDYLSKSRGRLTAGADRRIAQGVEGGRDGAVGWVIINPGTDKEQRWDTMVSNVELHPGDVLRIVAPSGGGFGRVEDRERQRVLDDLADGWITARKAREVYGLSEEEIVAMLGKG